MRSYVYRLQQAVQDVQMQGGCAELAYHRHTSFHF